MLNFDISETFLSWLMDLLHNPLLLNLAPLRKNYPSEESKTKKFNF
jgi:hypothetical protein